MDGGVLLADAAPPSAGDAGAVQRVLFVGDSLTHGRYTPVRGYNSGGTEGASGSPLVVDENFGQTGSRAELEPGPWGGVAGIFAEVAAESHQSFDVHIEAISATSLQTHSTVASSVIYQSKWNAVVLQELSTLPLSNSLSGSSKSNPSQFCNSVQTLEKGIHGVAPSAKIYLYETWARADTAQALSGSYTSNLALIGDALHNVFYSAAARDGHVDGVAPVGEAWARAWAEGVAEPNPFTPTTALPSLWYGMNAVNDPSITAPDRLHPSVYGAYLAALVLFQQITGTDVRTLGANEAAAIKLGVPGVTAASLQKVAWEAITMESAAPRNQTVDPCTVTH